MIVIIMCAGRGTRLKEETRDKPKCMVEVGGKPILERIANNYEKAGLDKIVVNLSFKPEKVMEYFGQRFMYLYEPVPMGEATTVAVVRRWFPNEDIVTVNGDTLITDPNIFNDKHCGVTEYRVDGEVVKKTGFDFIDMGTPEGLKKARKLYGKTTR